MRLWSGGYHGTGARSLLMCKSKSFSSTFFAFISLQFIIWTILFYAFAPQQNFTSIYTKKMSKTFWKRKKLEQLFENFWKFLRSKKIKNFRSRKISFSYNFQWKFLKFLRSKNFENFWSQFFSFSYKFKWIFSKKSKIFRSQKISKIFEKLL